MPTTRVTVHEPASPARVYAALVDPAAVERWRVDPSFTMLSG